MYFIQSSLWLVIARAVATIYIGQKIVKGAPVGVNVKEKCPFFGSKYWDKRHHSQRLDYTDRIYDDLECEITLRAHVGFDQP